MSLRRKANLRANCTIVEQSLIPPESKASRKTGNGRNLAYRALYRGATDRSYPRYRFPQGYRAIAY
jgi:hypothetical protein